MSDKEYTIADMIKTAKDEAPSEFQNAFNDVLHSKVSELIQQSKQAIAQNYFNNADEEQPEEEEQQDVEASAEEGETPNENVEATAGETEDGDNDEGAGNNTGA